MKIKLTTINKIDCIKYIIHPSIHHSYSMNCRPVLDLFWHPDKPFAPHFILPDTILYQDSNIHYWLFTAKDGTIKRKLHGSITKDKMKQRFSKGTQRTGVYAVLYFQSHDDLYGEIEIPKQSKGTFYFDEHAFEGLLNGKVHIIRGVLQKFVDAGFLNNALIEVNQARYFTTFIKRTAKSHIHNKEEPVYMRMVTFDGRQNHSLSNIVKGQLTFTLKHFMDEISDRVQMVSEHKHILKQFVAYFKKDIKGKVYFLYSPSTPVESFEKGRIDSPIHIHGDIDRQACINCGKPIQADEAMQSTFRVLFKNPRSKEYQQAAVRVRKEKGQFSPNQEVVACTECFLKQTELQSEYGQEQKVDDSKPMIERDTVSQGKPKKHNHFSRTRHQNNPPKTSDSRHQIRSQPNRAGQPSSQSFLPALHKNRFKGIEPKASSKKSLAKDLDNLLGRTEEDRLYEEGTLSIHKLRAQIDWLRERVPYEGQMRLKVLEQIVDSCS